MKYDDASWHFGGDYPSDLPEDNAYTHIGIYLAWILRNGMVGDIHTEEWPEEVDLVTEMKATGAQFLKRNCDGKLTDEDISELGNKFTKSYYESDMYISDYESVLGGDVSTLYHVEDTWKNYQRMERVIDKRFYDWKSGPKKWWQFWRV